MMEYNPNVYYIPQRLPLSYPVNRVQPGVVIAKPASSSFCTKKVIIIIITAVILLIVAASIAIPLGVVLSKKDGSKSDTTSSTANRTTTQSSTSSSSSTASTTTTQSSTSSSSSTASTTTTQSSTSSSSSTASTTTTTIVATTTTTSSPPIITTKFGQCPNGYVFNGNNCDECGTTNFAPNIKIVGGVQAVPNSWPAQVQFKFRYKFDFYYYSYYYGTVSETFSCGGTLINRYTILTAAHCIPSSLSYTFYGVPITQYVTPNAYYPTIASMITVYLGEHDISSISSPGVEAIVSAVIKHPSYNQITDANDIALLILKNPITPNNYIRPACLPYQLSSTYPIPNQSCFAVGWGTLSEGGSGSYILNNVKLTLYDASQCSRYNNFLTNSQICAGELAGGKDTCQGDSGGGLYVVDSSSGANRYVVSGIVSYGDGCARAGIPGVYTRTSYYLDWIKSNWKIS